MSPATGRGWVASASAVTSWAVMLGRAVATVIAVVAVVVFGPPAVCGWVPLPADEGLPGVAAGSLTIVEPVETPPTVEAGSIVAVTSGGDRLALGRVDGVTGDTVRLTSAEGPTTTPTSGVRAVERYRLPAAGRVYGALPAEHRMWGGRGLGALMLLWCGLELRATRRTRGRHARRPARTWWRRRDRTSATAPLASTALAVRERSGHASTALAAPGATEPRDLGTLPHAPSARARAASAPVTGPAARRALAAAYLDTDDGTGADGALGRDDGAAERRRHGETNGEAARRSRQREAAAVPTGTDRSLPATDTVERAEAADVLAPLVGPAAVGPAAVGRGVDPAPPGSARVGPRPSVASRAPAQEVTHARNDLGASGAGRLDAGDRADAAPPAPPATSTPAVGPATTATSTSRTSAASAGRPTSGGPTQATPAPAATPAPSPPERGSSERGSNERGSNERESVETATPPTSASAASESASASAASALRTSGTAGASEGTEPGTRRARAAARRRRRPWARLTGLAASAVGTVVLAARTLDHASEDPESDRRGGGRHRGPLPTRTITNPPHPPSPDSTHEDDPGADGDDLRGDTTSRVRRPTGGTLGGTPVTTVRRAARSGTRGGDAGIGGTAGSAREAREDGRDPWRAPPSPEEVRRAALIQDFEARRAAAEAAFLHAIPRRELLSPAERAVAERERTKGDTTGRSSERPGAVRDTRLDRIESHDAEDPS